ncbi:MAG: DUF1223 domain-containing protein [Pseudomonadota bacterium]
MRALSVLAATAFLFAPALDARAEMTAEPVEVVELFTSQGCSSCPPADELIGEMANTPGLLVLSLHVDYWDYLGWKDTFSSADYTLRQQGYARTRGDGYVATPQVVINGQAAAIGHDAAAIDAALTETDPDGDVTIALAQRGETVEVTIDNPNLLPSLGGGTLWLASYSPQEEVEIERGENRGLMATYTHVVKKLVPVAEWDGGDMTVDVPLEMFTAKDQRCALILQRGDVQNPADVIAAVAIKGDY